MTQSARPYQLTLPVGLVTDLGNPTHMMPCLFRDDLVLMPGTSGMRLNYVESVKHSIPWYRIYPPAGLAKLIRRQASKVSPYTLEAIPVLPGCPTCVVRRGALNFFYEEPVLYARRPGASRYQFASIMPQI